MTSPNKRLASKSKTDLGHIAMNTPDFITERAAMIAVNLGFIIARVVANSATNFQDQRTNTYMKDLRENGLRPT